MCQTGGVRCSPHAREKLQKKRTRLDTLVADNTVKTEAYNQAKEIFLAQDGSTDPKIARINEKNFKKTERELNTSRVKQKKAVAEYKLAVREYNGTDEGVKRLEDKISKAENAEEAKKYRTLLRQGKMLRSHRKHNAEMQKIEKETGLSLKERRGSFITLKGNS